MVVKNWMSLAVHEILEIYGGWSFERDAGEGLNFALSCQQRLENHPNGIRIKPLVKI